MMVDMKNRSMMQSWRKCMRLWLQSMKLIKFLMLLKDKAELVFTWHRQVKKHQILEQLLLLKIKIWCSHNTENPELSFGVVFQFNKWHINCVEIISIMAKVNKCQSTMVQKIWISAQSVHHYVPNFHKHQVPDTNIESTMKTRLLLHTLEKELPLRVISIQLWILLLP